MHSSCSYSVVVANFSIKSVNTMEHKKATKDEIIALILWTNFQTNHLMLHFNALSNSLCKLQPVFQNNLVEINMVMLALYSKTLTMLNYPQHFSYFYHILVSTQLMHLIMLKYGQTRRRSMRHWFMHTNYVLEWWMAQRLSFCWKLKQHDWKRLRIRWWDISMSQSKTCLCSY